MSLQKNGCGKIRIDRKKTRKGWHESGKNLQNETSNKNGNVAADEKLLKLFDNKKIPLI